MANVSKTITIRNRMLFLKVDLGHWEHAKRGQKGSKYLDQYRFNK